MRIKLVYIVVAFLLSIVFLGINLEIQSQRSDFYTRKFKENNIEQITNKSLIELDSIAQDLRMYLKQGENELLEKHFNSDEVSHMVDVFQLFQFMRRIVIFASLMVVLFIIILIRKNGVKYSLKNLGQGFWWLDIFLLISIGIISIDFNKYFILFHKLLFRNNLWLMDPDTDLMIQMLPEKFFSDMAFNIALGTLFLLIVFSLLGFIPIGKERKYGIK